MRLISIDDLEIDSLNFAARPLVTDRSERRSFVTRRRSGATGGLFVNVTPEPARWVIVFQCNDEATRDAVLAAMGGDVSEERRLLAERDDIASTRVVAMAAPVRIVQPNELDLVVEFESPDSVWLAEESSDFSKAFTSALDEAMHLDVPGNTRTTPQIILTPTAQRTASAGVNRGWRYRRRATITNTSDVPWFRHPCRISMGSTTALVSGGKVQADGDDVRLWYAGLELARSLVTWNTSASFIWFIIPALLPGESMDVDVMYGQSVAVSPPVLAYPDLPPFFLASSSNAIWDYPQDESVVGNSGLGIWHLSGDTEPITPDYNVPGAWHPVRTMKNPDNTEIGRQVISDNLGAADALARFSAERSVEAPAGTATGPLNDYDGVAFYSPLPIIKLRAGFELSNQDPGWCIGILCRNSGGEEWNQFEDDLNGVPGGTIAPADYTLPTPSHHLAVVLQPLNTWSNSNAAYADDISARGNDEWTVTLDDSDMFIILAAEEDVYELGTELRIGGGRDLVAPYRTLLIGNARDESGAGTPRAAITLTQALIIDADAHTHAIWNADLTTKIADLPAHAVSGVVGWDDDGQTAESPSSDWLPLSPTRARVPNGAFDADIGGWIAVPPTGVAFALQGTFLTTGSGNTNLDTPAQVAVDSSGNVYIADTANNRLKKHDSVGAFVAQITSLTGITGVAIDSSNNVYVAYGNLLRKYNSALVLQWTTSAVTGGVFKHVGTDGTHLYVVDDNSTTGPEVTKRLCSTGAIVSHFGMSGTGNGQFIDPYGIAVDSTHFYVTDRNLHRIQKFTKAGAYVMKWGSLGAGNTQFNAPRGIGLDDSGRLWVADYGNDRLQRFSNAGEYQQSIAQANPDGVDLATGDVLWVSNADSDNIAKWDEAAASASVIWEGSVDLGNGPGTLAIVPSGFTDGIEAAAINATWFPINGRESVEVAATVFSQSVTMAPLLRILWGDEDETVIKTDTEAVWTPPAGVTPQRRSFAARVPGRVTQYRIALVAHSTGASSGVNFFDGITINDNELILTDANLAGGGDLDVQVSIQGRWL